MYKIVSFILIIAGLFIVSCTETSTESGEQNNAPEIINITADPDTINIGDSSTLVCTAEDGDGDNLTYVWEAIHGSINGSGSSVLWISPSTAGTYFVRCSVLDGMGGVTTDSVGIVVESNISEEQNNAPEILNIIASPDTVGLGDFSILDCIAEDSDGDTLTYIWEAINGAIYGTGNSVLWLAPSISGTYFVKCSVLDGNGGETVDSVGIVVELDLPEEQNNAPEILSITADPSNIETGDPSILNCIAVDADGDNLTYLWESVDGSLFGSGSSVLWIAPSTDGIYYVKCSVSDGQGGETVDSVSIVVGLETSVEGLVGYWSFNGNADDNSGNNNHGTPIGAELTYDRNGNPESAYYLDGVNDYIHIPHNNILKPNLPLTVSAWIRCDSTGGGVLDTNFKDDFYLGVFIKIRYETDEILFAYGDGGFVGDEARRAKSTTPPQSGNWFHFVGVMRGPNDMSIYINGEDAGGYYSGTGGSIEYDDSPMNIGRLDTGRIQPADLFKGALDQIRIYNRALSDDEALILYQSGE